MKYKKKYNGLNWVETLIATHWPIMSIRLHSYGVVRVWGAVRFLPFTWNRSQITGPKVGHFAILK